MEKNAVIHVGASVSSIPKTWYDQLAVGGVLVVPMPVSSARQQGIKMVSNDKNSDLDDGGHVVLTVTKHSESKRTLKFLCRANFEDLIEDEQQEHPT